MNTSLFIAKRLIKESKHSKKNSQTIIKIAHWSTILAVLVMVLTIFIADGFERNIISKVRGYSSDILISHFGFGESYEANPIRLADHDAEAITKLPEVKVLKPYISKPAIIKFQDLIEGIVLKSYEEIEQYDFFRNHMVKGRLPKDNKQEILISEVLANKLNLDTSQYVYIYFIQNPVRYRKLKVVGVFNTSLLEFDKIFALVNPRLLGKINNWEAGQYSGVEVVLNKYKTVEEVKELKAEIEDIIDTDIFNESKGKDLYQVQTLDERHPEFQFWFALFETNVLVIVFLMTAVALVNLVSAVLILILENKNLIALLKIMGQEDKKVKQIFLYVVGYLTLRGLLIGNFLALILSFSQYYGQIIPLDAVHYYISYVPISFDWVSLIFLNISVLFAIFLGLFFPLNYTLKIKPINILRIN